MGLTCEFGHRGPSMSFNCSKVSLAPFSSQGKTYFPTL